ncbi:membrane protein, partial [Devosia psychrophila]
TYLMSAILVGVIALQFAQKRYVPWAYWSAVVMVSVVGTLLTDNLIDTFGVPLATTTIACTVVLAVIFAAWYASEKTLSIHTVVTTRREVFYWLAVLATFALGTAAGEYVSEALGVGYLITGTLFGAIIAAIAFAHYVLKMNAILAFWLAYIFTRPLGASLGDLLSQPTDYGGMGFGTIVTSAMFLAVIAAIVVYMTVMRGPGDGARAVR